ncbi:MAG: amidohydrolase, partial [Microvirga sp.]
MPVINRVADLADEIAGWRRDLHENPELLFDVHRTAGVVADKLKAFGCDEVVTGIGRTGVVAVIKGKRGASGKVVGIRADMDALPIEEATNLPYRSTSPGKMHACGHDGHTTMLLGAARYLAETRDFDRTAVFIFQPAEEGLGGARAMLADGLFERFPCDEIYALHNAPEGPQGQVSVHSGAMMAAADFFDIRITGRGAHGAHPHQA